MPQLTSVTLTDRTSPTPVNHTFTPFDIKNGVGYLKSGSGTPVGDKILAVSSRATGTRHKGKITLMLPTVQTQVINGISTPLVVRRAHGDINLSFDSTSTLEERNNLEGMLEDALKLAKTFIHGTVVELQGVY